MKDQSDVYHYMNPSKNAPHFDELLNGKDLKKMIRKKGRNPINISILWIFPPPLSFHGNISSEKNPIKRWILSVLLQNMFMLLKLNSANLTDLFVE